MGVDVRAGFQVECINCGRCLDACRTIMQKRSNGNGLIAYRFGEKSCGRPRLSGSVIILALLFAVFSALLVYGSVSRAEISFAVQRNPFITTGKLSDGTVIQAWNGTLDNRSQHPASLEIVLEPGSPEGVKLVGQVNGIEISPNNNRQVLFFLHLPAAVPKGSTIGLLLLRSDGTSITRLKIRL
jgi:polyferredoxin